MENSLKKFSRLPASVREKLSSPLFLSVIEKLEEKYQTKLTLTFIKLVVKDLNIEQLNSFLVQESGISVQAAEDIKTKFIELLNKMNKKSTPQPIKMRPAPSSDKADFNFFAEDSQEIQQFQELANGQKKKNFTALAEKIMMSFGYDGQDEILTKRLLNIIISKLKDVRDDMETTDVLSKDKKIGGLEFTPDQVERLLSLIKQEQGTSSQPLPSKSKIDFFQKSKAQSPPVNLNRKISKARPSTKEKLKKIEKKVIASKPAPSKTPEPAPPSPPASPDASPGEPVPEPKPAVSKKKNLPQEKRPKIKLEDGLPVIEMPDEEKNQPKPVVEKQPPQLPKSRPTPSQTPEPAPPEIIETKPQPQLQPEKKKDRNLPPPTPAPFLGQKKSFLPLKATKAPSGHKPNLDDVKFSAKLVGPVEELANMTLIDFRRYGDKPQERIRKIKEKFDLLEKESYERRIEGVEAWHKSEVNKFYRLLGQSSMKEGKNMEEIINQRLAAGKPTLSVDEFNAVMELNKQIRF